MMCLKWVAPILFLFGLMNIAFANTIDSLNTALQQSSSDKSKGEIYYELGQVYWKERNYQEAEKKLLLATQYFAKANEHQGVNDAYFILGRSYYEQARFDDAISSFSTAKEYALAHDRPKDAANEYNAIGITYKSIGKFPEAVKAYQASLKVYNDLDFEEGMAAANHNLGSVYGELAKLDTALVHYQYALDLRKETGSDREVGQYLQSIADIYRKQENYEQAIEFAKESIIRFAQAKDTTGLINAHGTIGLVYLDQKYFAKAERKIQYILPMAEQFKYNLPNTYISLGQINQGLKNHQKALSFFQKALDSAPFSVSGNVTSDIFLAMSESYEYLGSSTKALNSYKKHIALKDSIQGLEIKEQVEELTTQYQSKLKDDKIALLAKDNQINRAIIFGILMIGLLLGVVGWLIVRTKRLRATQHNLELKQRLLRAQIKPHFLFNALTAIQSFTLKNGIEAGAVYLASFAKLMRSILENSNHEYVPIANELESIGQYLQLEKLRHGDLFNYSIQCDSVIQQEKVYVPPMLMQPFLENAIKHGFAGKDNGGQINIKIDQVDNQIQFSISDNGVGIGTKSQKPSGHKSRSIQITQDRLEVLNKKLREKVLLKVQDLSKNNQETTGTLVTFRLPIVFGE